MADRRQKGNGTVFQLKSGKWVAKITINGKSKVRKFNSKSEAKQKLPTLKRELKAELNKEEERKARGTRSFGDTTLEQYFDKFLEYKKRTLKNTSYIRLESIVNTHIKPYLGTVRMANITEDVIQNRLDEAHRAGMSYSSVKKIYDAFKGCFNYAVQVKRDIEPRDNVMYAVQMIPEKNFFKKHKEPRYLINEEGNNERKRFVQEAMRKYSNGRPVYRYGAALVFIMNTGLRESEMCGLCRENIFEDEKYINVCDTVETVRNDKGKWVTHLNPNNTKWSSERYVPLNKQALEALDVMKEIFPPTVWTDTILYSTNNKILPTSELNKTFNRICYAANIDNMDGVGPHCLRHTFATSLFEQNVDIKIISELLGHSSVKVTQDIYISISRQLKKDALIEINDYV